MGPLHVTFTLLASVLLVAFLTGCSGTLIDTPEHLQIPVIIGSGEIVTTFDKKKVRGNAPVYYCSDPKTDLFEIEAIDIVPFPPVYGQYVTARIWGFYLTLTGPNPTVRYNNSNNNIPWISFTYELCNTYMLDSYQGPYGSGGRRCPPVQEWAEITFTYLFENPAGGPNFPGNFSQRAEFLTSDNQTLFCIEGSLYV